MDLVENLPWFIAFIDDTPAGMSGELPARTPDGIPVGIACVVDYPQESPSSHLEGMWVHPAVRRRGVGRQLLGRVEEWVLTQGKDRLGLWVVVGNEVAEGLYLKQGYRGTCRGLGALPDGRKEEEFQRLLDRHNS